MYIICVFLSPLFFFPYIYTTIQTNTVSFLEILLSWGHTSQVRLVFLPIMCLQILKKFFKSFSLCAI